MAAASPTACAQTYMLVRTRLHPLRLPLGTGRGRVCTIAIASATHHAHSFACSAVICVGNFGQREVSKKTLDNVNNNIDKSIYIIVWVR